MPFPAKRCHQLVAWISLGPAIVRRMVAAREDPRSAYCWHSGIR